LEKTHTALPADELTTHLQAINRNGHRMRNIIDELLLLAGVRKKQVQMVPLDMQAIVTNAQRRLSYIIQETQAEIIFPSHWPVASGYSPWVEEIWVNYISNGLKYGGQPPRLELGGQAEQKMARFWVQDNGRGLKPEEQAQLFTQFTQLSQVRAEGHGLGLSIVQRIVERLHGRVGVESDGIEGRGSCFSFTLPLASEPLTSTTSVSQI
jgi:signal transduction histidine kinase